ncbi:hypothetical protein K3152_13650 [Qipengyuania sp. 1NDH17]|uniref:Uncharacterized protein n=1 Tax=Qipengyuania polymorpha TaxID=2867234 RepID=A0ABS7J753_9SPHN|nr:hypothetical protein [Qipengyuania polymorpha]MBX7459293.1 hypothetical protein [Qipengyuania polymorpha]
MDADLFLIFAFILIAGSIIFAFASLTHRRANAHEERMAELRARKAEAENGSSLVAADHRKLEERVRVLERIATDSNHALASQIEELRALDAIEHTTEERERIQ